jgi:hypothetical protein
LDATNVFLRKKSQSKKVRKKTTLQQTTTTNNTKIPDPLFSHSAMGRKNLEKYRPIQFFTRFVVVFSKVKYSLPFGLREKFHVNVYFFQILTFFW